MAEGGHPPGLPSVERQDSSGLPSVAGHLRPTVEMTLTVHYLKNLTAAKQSLLASHFVDLALGTTFGEA